MQAWAGFPRATASTRSNPPLVPPTGHYLRNRYRVILLCPVDIPYANDLCTIIRDYLTERNSPGRNVPSPATQYSKCTAVDIPQCGSTALEGKYPRTMAWPEHFILRIFSAKTGK